MHSHYLTIPTKVTCLSQQLLDDAWNKAPTLNPVLDVSLPIAKSPLQPSLLRHNTKPLQIPLQHLPHIPNRPRLHRHRRFNRIRSHMRYQHHTWIRQQTGMHGGFILIDIQPGTTDLAAL